MKILPFRSFNETDIVNQYSLTTTGEMGTFVSISAANMDNQHNWSTATPGASYDHIHSYRYETKATVRPCASGDNKFNVLGYTLFNVLEEDENGELYKFYKQKAVENSVVLSGEAVPVVTDGVVTLKSDAYVGTPTINAAVLPADDGKVRFASSSFATSTGANGSDAAFAKVIGTGSKQGGYAMIKFV